MGPLASPLLPYLVVYLPYHHTCFVNGKVCITPTICFLYSWNCSAALKRTMHPGIMELEVSSLQLQWGPQGCLCVCPWPIPSPFPQRIFQTSTVLETPLHIPVSLSLSADELTYYYAVKIVGFKHEPPQLAALPPCLNHLNDFGLPTYENVGSR